MPLDEQDPSLSGHRSRFGSRNLSALPVSVDGCWNMPHGGLAVRMMPTKITIILENPADSGAFEAAYSLTAPLSSRAGGGARPESSLA